MLITLLFVIQVDIHQINLYLNHDWLNDNRLKLNTTNS